MVAILVAAVTTADALPARASTYPNPGCTIPHGDYYDFYDDCAAYTNWNNYFPGRRDQHGVVVR